ncbi:MAG: hypothetical protein HWN69_06910 [Desulfobacterales bacterium]|nr:hypothetical protein [Desulfobacterales bacterium]
MRSGHRILPDSLLNGTIFGGWHRPIYKRATKLVGHIDVCLVREIRYILPFISRMRIDLTQKEISLDGLCATAWIIVYLVINY